LEDLAKVASDRGGSLISDEYVNNKKPLKWRCGRGHKFEASYYAVNHRGQWCPKCKPKSRRESYIRQLLEAATGYLFPSCRPDWLRTDDGSVLELDGYSADCAIAFEHHGEQHYTRSRMFHRDNGDFVEQVERDQLKLRLCSENNVHLITVKYDLPLAQIVHYIHDQLDERGVYFSKSIAQEIVNSSTKDMTALNNIREIAEQKNGKCLSDSYYGSKEKLEFQCANGHVWSTLPGSIISGSWCVRCTGTHKKTIEEVVNIGRKIKLSCLSESYINNHTKLDWKCSCGHTFSTEIKVLLRRVRNSSYACIKCKRKVSL